MTVEAGSSTVLETVDNSVTLTVVVVSGCVTLDVSMIVLKTVATG